MSSIKYSRYANEFAYSLFFVIFETLAHIPVIRKVTEVWAFYVKIQAACVSL
jgi:hypothetical protein